MLRERGHFFGRGVRQGGPSSLGKGAKERSRVPWFWTKNWYFTKRRAGLDGHRIFLAAMGSRERGDQNLDRGNGSNHQFGPRNQAAQLLGRGWSVGAEC